MHELLAELRLGTRTIQFDAARRRRERWLGGGMFLPVFRERLSRAHVLRRLCVLGVRIGHGGEGRADADRERVVSNVHVVRAVVAEVREVSMELSVRSMEELVAVA